MPLNPAPTETGIFENGIICESLETGIFMSHEEPTPLSQTLDISEVLLRRSSILNKLLPGVVDECAEVAKKVNELSFADRFRSAIEQHSRVMALIGKERGILQRALNKIIDIGIPEKELEDLIIGQSLVGKKIGNGGFGDTYEAVINGKSVVIKVDAPKKVSPAVAKQASARFTREIEVMEQISEGVPKILGKGHLSDRKQFFIMERVHGHTLHDIMHYSDCEPLPSGFTNDVLALLARQLTLIHKKTISHRDIKPQNIMIDHEGRLFLIDFGFGKALDVSVSDLTASGQMMGTPHYASYEQMSGASATTDSDNFSLGILAYKMYEGDLPFPGDTMLEVLEARRGDSPPMKQCIDKKKERIVQGLMLKDPDLRLSSEDAGKFFFEQSSFSSKNGGKYKKYQDFLNALHANLKIAMPTSFPEDHAVHLGALEVASAEYIHQFHRNRQHATPSVSPRYSLPKIAGGATGVLAFTLAVGAVMAMMFRENGPEQKDNRDILHVKPVDPNPLKKDEGDLGKKDNNGTVIPSKIIPEKLQKKPGVIHATTMAKGWSYSMTLGAGLPLVEYPREKGQHYERLVGKKKEPAGSSMMYDKEFLAQMEGVPPDNLPDYMTKDVLGQETEVIVHKYFASGYPDRPGLFIMNKILVLPDLRKKEDRAEGDPDTVAFADGEFVNMRIALACSAKDKDGQERGICSHIKRRDHPVFRTFFALCPQGEITTLPDSNISGSQRSPGWFQTAWRRNLDTFKNK